MIKVYNQLRGGMDLFRIHFQVPLKEVKAGAPRQNHSRMSTAFSFTYSGSWLADSLKPS